MAPHIMPLKKAIRTFVERAEGNPALAWKCFFNAALAYILLEKQTEARDYCRRARQAGGERTENELLENLIDAAFGPSRAKCPF